MSSASQESTKPDNVKFGSDRVFPRKRGRVHRVRMNPALFMACILLGLLMPQTCEAQNTSNQAVFLVARREIHDPFFEYSVVMMVPTKRTPLIVGLIINKPTRFMLYELFPKSPALKNRTEPAYFGGPVDVRVPSVAFRSPTAPKEALRLYGKVYLTFDPDEIKTALQNSQQATSPRLFLGRAQWAPAQLENEVQRGSWYRLRANGDLIFSSNPQALWRQLHARAAPSKYIKYRFPARSSCITVRKAALTD